MFLTKCLAMPPSFFVVVAENRSRGREGFGYIQIVYSKDCLMSVLDIAYLLGLNSASCRIWRLFGVLTCLNGGRKVGAVPKKGVGVDVLT